MIEVVLKAFVAILTGIAALCKPVAIPVASSRLAHAIFAFALRSRVPAASIMLSLIAFTIQAYFIVKLAPFSGDFVLAAAALLSVLVGMFGFATVPSQHGALMVLGSLVSPGSGSVHLMLHKGKNLNKRREFEALARIARQGNINVLTLRSPLLVNRRRCELILRQLEHAFSAFGTSMTFETGEIEPYSVIESEIFRRFKKAHVDKEEDRMPYYDDKRFQCRKIKLELRHRSLNQDKGHGDN